MIELDPRESAAAAEIEATFRPQNGQVLVRVRPLSSSVIIPTANMGKSVDQAPTFDWRFDVVAAAETYWSATAGAHLPVPFQPGDVVTVQPGAWQSFPFPGWKGLCTVYWEHILGKVEESAKPEARKAKGQVLLS